MLRRQRDADAGVGGHLVAQAIIGHSDRFEDAIDEVGTSSYRRPGLHMAKFVAAEPRHEIGVAHAAGQALATDFSNSSPAMCPSESLTPLNSSMSI